MNYDSMKFFPNVIYLLEFNNLNISTFAVLNYSNY